MKKLLSMVFLLAVAVLTLSFLATPATLAEGDGAKAQELFVETHKCNMCHGVAAAGIEPKTKSEKMQGPDLSGYSPDKSLAEIAGYVRKQAELDGKSHTKEFKGSDEELQAILDWLGSLEAKK